MRNDPTTPDCKLCHIEPAVENGIGKRCLRGLQIKRKKQAREVLKVATVTELKTLASLPPEERQRLQEAASVEFPRPAVEKAQEDAVAVFRRWRAEPWTFVQEALGATPDAWQSECLHALIDSGYEKFALKACKGPGKTCLLAWVILWFLTCFEHPKCLATSITGENLRDGLWTELALWMKRSRLLTSLFEWQTERIFSKEHPETWYVSARTWPKDADKTKQANTLAGVHGKNTLIVLDEAGDIPESVLAAGLAHHSTQSTSGPKEIHYTLMCGNPTRTDGALGVACTRDRAQWWVKEITGDPDDPQRAPRMDLKWCEEQINTWGADNPWVLVNVFGKFPPTQDNKLLGPEIVKTSMRLVVPEAVWREQQRVAGLDVARSLASDRSSLARRQGRVVFPFKIWRLDDANQLTSQVAFELARFKPVAVFVDATGIGGPVADNLRALGFNVVMVYFGNPARDRRFADKRTEIWWTMAQEIKGTGGEPHLALPDDPELVGELSAPEVVFNARGQMKLESKESLKKRGLSSPDLADSLACTYAEPIWVSPKVSQTTHDALVVGRAEIDYDPFSVGEKEPVWREVL